ncbi:MAG: alpha/beta fold hydrolase [Bacteroidales bacterium]
MKKRKAIFVSILLLTCGWNAAADVHIGHISVEMTDNERGNRKIPVDIYYPSEDGGPGSSIIISKGQRYPIICFAHGYLLQADLYPNIWEALVPEGFIMIFLKTETGLFPSLHELAEDMVFALAEAERYGRDEESMFYNLVDTMNCVMGHSMGGRASWLAAAKSPETIKAAVLLAPLYKEASGPEAETNRNMPLLIISGSNDCITSTANHAMPLYNESTGDKSTLIEIKGGSHCQMCEDMALCRFGEAVSLCKAAISREEQHAVIERYLVPWLRFYLKGDADAGALFDSRLSSDAAVSFFRNEGAAKKQR